MSGSIAAHRASAAALALLFTIFVSGTLYTWLEDAPRVGTALDRRSRRKTTELLWQGQLHAQYGLEGAAACVLVGLGGASLLLFDVAAERRLGASMIVGLACAAAACCGLVSLASAKMTPGP